MSISFSPTELFVIATCVARNDSFLVLRALARFEKEFAYYRSATHKAGLLKQVRLYHRLLLDEIRSYQANHPDDLF